jgi:hypothetical protein
MKRIGLTAMIALWAGLGASSAEAAQAMATPPCVSGPEATSLLLALAPDAIKAVGTACAQQLPPTSLLRQTSGPFIAKYQAEADASWPLAQSAIGKISGAGDKDMQAILGSDMMRPMLAAMIVPMIAKAIKPKDCAAVDHIVTLLEPLPAHNSAELVTTVLQLSAADKAAKGEKQGLPICPMVKP